jgi:hypothetical protein
MDIIRIEAIAAKQPLKLDLTGLRKAISKLHKASSKLDHAKYKAEKKLRKALLRLGKEASRHGHRKHRRACLKRRWNKLKNFVKSMFGVYPGLNEQHEVQSRHGEHEETTLDEVQSTQAIVWEESELVPVEGAPTVVEQGEVDNIPGHQEKGPAIDKVRAGLAVGQSPSKREEDRRSFLNNVRVGKAGAGKWGSTRGTELQERRSTMDHPSRDDGASVEKRNRHKSRPCMRSPQDIGPHTWLVSPNRTAPKKGPLQKVFKAAQAVRRVNAKLAGFERGFIHVDGIKDREWFRHLGVAPGKWLGYGATTFPALTEALDEKNLTLATGEAKRLVKLVHDLAKFLKL